MRTWITKNAVVSYYIFAIAFSWAYWFILLSYGVRLEPGSTATHLPGLLGPAIAAILVTMVIGGSNGTGELFSRIIRLPSPRFSNILFALSPLALGFMTYGGMYILGQPLPTLEAFSHYPGMPQHWPWC